MRTNKLKLYPAVLAIVMLIFTGCKEQKLMPLEENGIPPGQVGNVKVENLSGRVRISYTLPKDQDLLYVKAVYDIRPGTSREIKSSYYSNTMDLDGFADEDEHEVKLYAVNRSEVASAPLSVMVKPLENPIWGVFRSLQILPDFAGVRIMAQNPSQADVAVEILRKDSLGRWTPFLPYIYSSQKEISQTSRGLDTLAQEFAATVRDRFLNYTDTLFNKISPFYEEALSKSLFKALKLPGDAKIQTVTPGIPTIWDGDNNPNNSNRMLTDVADLNPQWISIDLGKLAKLSRVKIWNYAEFMSNGNHQFYYRGQLRFFEVWGSADPNPDGSWDSWTKMGTFENTKPSRLPYGQTSAEDWEKAAAGFDYNLDTNVPKVRFLRIKSIENWMGTSWFEIKEINVYGDTR
ncbi:DUF5000 domain-containing lipoprotein [Sphingobacterium puteale]|uniref:DUF5000 domain-containing lipoprotein n=1 Tax=Sphingobacterium puteale TaxID=2420510 RepID=UPI003D9962C4